MVVVACRIGFPSRAGLTGVSRMAVLWSRRPDAGGSRRRVAVDHASVEHTANTSDARDERDEAGPDEPHGHLMIADRRLRVREFGSAGIPGRRASRRDPRFE